MVMTYRSVIVRGLRGYGGRQCCCNQHCDRWQRAPHGAVAPCGGPEGCGLVRLDE
ncbi:MAG: hypothetical protein RL030_2417 [Pseudomonadota bacterium]